MPVHLIIIPLLAIYYSGVLKISQIFVFPLYTRSTSFEDAPSFKSFNSTGATYLLNHFNFRKINYHFFSTVFVSSVSKLPLVFPAHPPFFLKDQISYSSTILLCEVSPFLFRQCSYPVILMKILTELQVHRSSFFFFSDGFKSSFVDHTFFLVSMLSHAGAPHYHSTSHYLLFRSAEDISKIRVSTLHSFKLFRGCSLIQVI